MFTGWPSIEERKGVPLPLPARHRLALAFLAFLPAAARAEDRFRSHPECAARMAALKQVGVVSPVMKLFELTASNDRVFQPEWSDQARDHVLSTVEADLRARGISAVRFDPPVGKREELRDVALLYEAVASAIVQATYANQFPAKVARFEYELGDLRDLLGPENDALLFAYGYGHISSGGRKALQALSAIVSGVSSRGVDRLTLALVDRGGTVLWFDTLASTQYDLRDPDSASSFVHQLTDDLPPVRK